MLKGGATSVLTWELEVLATLIGRRKQCLHPKKKKKGGEGT